MSEFNDGIKKQPPEILFFGPSHDMRNAIQGVFEEVAKNPHRYTPTANARLALEITKQYLCDVPKGEAREVANCMLRLIGIVEMSGVTELPVSAGNRHEETNRFSGEFGSTSSDVRLYRFGEPEVHSIEKTQLALSVHVVPRNDLGNSWVRLAVCLPNEEEFFGINGKELKMSLILFENNQTAELTIRSPLDDVSSLNKKEEMNRVYKLSTKEGENPVRAIKDIEYSIEPNGIIRLYK